MTVAELIELLKHVPQDAEVNVDRGGAYDTAKSIDVYNATDKAPALVFISSEPREVY